MHLFYLPGNSPSNKAWIEAVKSYFDTFTTGDILYYDHWSTGEKFINLDTESTKLSALATAHPQYSIFAKSVGTILTLKNIFEQHIHPQKLILCGLPVRLASDLNLPLADYLRTLAIPSIFVQNESDPVCSFTDLESVLKKSPPTNYQLLNNPGQSTHDYEDYHQLASLARDFFSKV